MNDLLPIINQPRCTGCRRCVEACPVHALDQVNDKAYLRYPELCTYCTLCEDICPTNAIALPFLIVMGTNAISSQQPISTKPITNL